VNDATVRVLLKCLATSQCWLCANTDSVMRCCMAHQFCALVLYDCVRDMHESTIKTIIIILDMK